MNTFECILIRNKHIGKVPYQSGKAEQMSTIALYRQPNASKCDWTMTKRSFCGKCQAKNVFGLFELFAKEINLLGPTAITLF